MTSRTQCAARLMLAAVLVLGLHRTAGAQVLDLDTATVADLNAAFDKGTLTAEKLVQL